MTDPTPASDALVAELREIAAGWDAVDDPPLLHAYTAADHLASLLARLDAQTRTIEHYKRWLDEVEADRDRWKALALLTPDPSSPVEGGE